MAESADSIYDELAAVAKAAGNEAGVEMIAASLMIQSERQTRDLVDDLLNSEVRAHAATQRRLDAALDHIERIRHRCAWLAGDVDELDPATNLHMGPFST